MCAFLGVWRTIVLERRSRKHFCAAAALLVATRNKVVIILICKRDAGHDFVAGLSFVALLRARESGLALCHRGVLDPRR